MKYFAPLLALLLAAGLSGCGTPSTDNTATASHYIVTVSCSDPEVRFAGTITSDGRAQEYSGKGSGEFHASGKAVTCSFKKLDPQGRISLAAKEGSKELGSSSTGEGLGGVQAELLRTPGNVCTLFTTF